MMVVSGTIHVHLQTVKSYTFRCLITVLLYTCFNLIYLCAADLESGLDEKEGVTGATHEEEKMSMQNDADLPESKEEEINTLSLKQAEIREYNHFESIYMLYHCNFHRHKHNFSLFLSFLQENLVFSTKLVFRTFSPYRNDQRGKQWETWAAGDDPCLQSTCPAHVC